MKETYKYSYKVNEKQLSSLSVYNVGYQKCEPGYQWGPGIRNHFLIHYVLEGKGCYNVNGEKYELKKGDTFIVYPEVQVSYAADSKEPWEYTWVGFAGSDAAAILRETDFSEALPVIRNQDELIKTQIMDIYNARGNLFENAVGMTGALYTLLGTLMRSSVNTADNTELWFVYVKRAVEYVAGHFSYGIGVEDIARYVGISRSQLFRAFKRCQKKSPKEYLTQFRINQAERLLKSTDLSVISIAYSVGYENNLYFSKAFKKETGKTPSEYRQSNRE